ncbi:MAG: T9SS type A sorting domain-containing protein [Bacteroidales bacterium]|nr:T9SS type A sorting domain-containing protein [Bacteroidales bacterium]
MKTLILIFLPITILAQTWTNPINISPNLPGLDNQPDLCIDKNGNLHCVFTHKLESNWRKIYYSKSTDDGATWTTPEDISLNPDISLMNPHIVADTNNTLYVTYDYNTGNPAMTLIYLKTFDGNQWSEPFVVSEGMYNSDNNRIYIDNNNRIYVFWLYINQLMYYRHFENNIWSDTICPYPGDHDWMLFSASIDKDNDIHCVGYFSDPGPPVFPQSIVYFKYEFLNNYWTDNTVISVNASGGGLEIDIDGQNNPHIAYRQKNIGSVPSNDSTMYTFFDGNNWSEPELVVNDPYEQKIAIDHFNRVHILDREKLETGKKIVHYQKVSGFWQGYIVDIADFYIGLYLLFKSDQKLYIAYYRSDEEGEGDIYFSRYDIVTGLKEVDDQAIILTLNIYPNPFKTQTTIEFTTSREQQINISIYNLNGQHIKTLMNENTVRGEYRLIWKGKGKHGKEVSVLPGLYLVRLQSGRKIVTKAVGYIK